MSILPATHDLRRIPLNRRSLYIPRLLSITHVYYYEIYSVVAHVEGVLEHAANHLRREQRQLRDKRRGDGVEVVAFVGSEAARGADFSEVT